MPAGKGNGGVAAADEARTVHGACRDPSRQGCDNLLQPPGHAAGWLRRCLPLGEHFHQHRSAILIPAGVTCAYVDFHASCPRMLASASMTAPQVRAGVI